MHFTPTLVRRSLVVMLAIATLVGHQTTLMRSVRCAKANATHHAMVTNAGGAQVSKTRSDAAEIHAVATGSTKNGSSDGHTDHQCPSPIGVAFIAPAIGTPTARWSRTSFSGRAPPEPTRVAIDPLERPPRNDSGLLLA